MSLDADLKLEKGVRGGSCGGCARGVGGDCQGLESLQEFLVGAGGLERKGGIAVAARAMQVRGDGWHRKD